MGWNAPKNNLERTIEFLRIEWDLGASLEEASYKWNMDEEYTDEHFGEDELFIQDSRGFDIIA